MAQANPYDSSLSQYDYNPRSMVESAQTDLDIPTMLAQVVGAMVKNYSSPQGGMSAGGEYEQGATPMVTSGLDEFQASMGKGKTPSAGQSVSGGQNYQQPPSGFSNWYGQQPEPDPSTYGYF